MAGNTPAVSTGAKDFGTISANQGAVIGDVSGCATVIGSSPVYISIDLMLNTCQPLRQTTIFNIQASRHLLEYDSVLCAKADSILRL